MFESYITHKTQKNICENFSHIFKKNLFHIKLDNKFYL